MYQNYNYYPQQTNTLKSPTYLANQPLSTGLKGRPVSSIDEARASLIDFDGSIFFFPDLANRRIYTKQVNIDGTATLNMYEFKELPAVQAPAASNFVTREEFDRAIAQLQSAIAPAHTTSAPTAQKSEVLPFN